MTILDSDAGYGVGVPIAASVSAQVTFAQPMPYTLLPLHRYAKIMGINPAHFSRAIAPNLNPVVFPAGGSCTDIWPRYSWQNADQVSHYDLAVAIQDAEADIARELGYYPAPAWISKEMHQYPRHYNRQVYGGGNNVRGMGKSVRAKWGKFISAGRRATASVGTVTTPGGTLAYEDQDGDGLAETAVLRIAVASTITNACEVKVYFVGHGGEQGWEIRPARRKSISNSLFTAEFDAWLFIDPDLLEAYPTDEGFSAIDISTTANYVDSVEVWREYTDTTQASAEFYWEPEPALHVLSGGVCSLCSGSGCASCVLTTQTGCLHVRDVNSGTAVPTPATYNSTTSQWASATWTECREPDQVKIWYEAGDLSNEFLAGDSCEPLSDYWAHTIAWLATARLERELCGCSNLQTIAAHLREDYAVSNSDASRFTPETILTNPFGTKRGEVMAWQRVSQYGQKQFVGVAV